LNKEKPIRDQAERLRKRVERKSEHTIEKKESLPPRSELHRQKQKKTKVKVKYPVIRLMALFFILLPISFFSIISYLDGKQIPLNKTLERAGVEMINVESHEDNKQGQDTDEDNEAPAYEEIDDTDKIEIIAAAGHAPSSSGDKNTSETPVESEEKESEKSTVPASSAPESKPSETEGSPNTGEAVSEGSNEKIIYHTVKPSETIFRVAMTYYKSQEGIPIIKKANNIQGNEIQAGQVLKIPIKN
jgi:LysM repeat protein